MSKLVSAAAALAAVISAAALQAADWPQWRGPDRTDVSPEKGLLQSWPSGGPTLLWPHENAGIGYAGVSVVGGKLFTLGARDNVELLLCLDAKTGEELWSAKLGKQFVNGWGDGPRTTPSVDGDTVFALGAEGTLIAAKVADGNVLWTKNLRSDLGGKMMSGWGYSESPLVDGDHVVVTPGGKNGAVAALDKKTGSVIWRSKAFTDSAAYSSLVPAEIGGVRQYVQMTGESVVGIAAQDGALLWRYARSGPTAAIPTPVVADGLVFATSGYGAGCHMIKVTAEGGTFKAEEVYANKNMTNHHGGVVKVGDHLYGYSEGKGWVCQEFATGKMVWNEKDRLGKGSLTCADGRLYCYSEKGGNCVLVEPSPAGWKEHGRFKIPRETKLRKPSGGVWVHPVVSDGRLYLRDQELIFCFDVKAK
jgi:outer membrane protein assembly factor BamB